MSKPYFINKINFVSKLFLACQDIFSDGVLRNKSTSMFFKQASLLDYITKVLPVERIHICGFDRPKFMQNKQKTSMLPSLDLSDCPMQDKPLFLV